MDIGRMRHRITLQHRIKTKNEWNENVYEWVDFVTVWASVEPISGREYWASSQVQAEVTHKIWIRYLAGVKPTMRVLFNQRIFEIESAINWRERNESLQLMCKEVVS